MSVQAAISRATLLGLLMDFSKRKTQSSDLLLPESTVAALRGDLQSLAVSRTSTFFLGPVPTRSRR